MPNFVHILLRILAFALGTLLLYVAFFLYEDEEARIQNRLEQIWQKINALQSRAMSKEVAFLQGVTRTISTILDRLFGNRLVSQYALLLSAAFSLASLILWLSFIDMEWGVSSLGLLLVVLCLAALLLLEALYDANRVPQRFDVWHLPLLALLSVLMMGAGALELETLGRHGGIGMIPVDVVGGHLETVASTDLSVASAIGDGVVLAVGVLIDVGFIVFFRWILRKIAAYSSVWSIIISLILVTGVAVLLTSPAVIITAPSLNSRFLSHADSFVPKLIRIICFASMTNLLEALCLVLLFSVMALLLAHRPLWPLVKRPIYAANRKQLVRNSKLLGALGTMLLLYAFPNNPVVKWITHFLPNLKGG